MSKFCPDCGEKLVDDAKFCKSCGKELPNYNGEPNVEADISNRYQRPVFEKSHLLATVLGVLCAFLVPLFGLIFGVYLATRKDSEKSKKYGLVIIGISVLMWIINFLRY